MKIPTPQLSLVKIQDTPIKSLRLDWWEGSTLNSVDVPVSWAFQMLLVESITDEVINSTPDQEQLIKCIENSLPSWLQLIKADEEWQISKLQCSVENLPEVFQPVAA